MLFLLPQLAVAAEQEVECFAACFAERSLEDRLNHEGITAKELGGASSCRANHLDEALAKEHEALAIRAGGYREYQERIDEFNDLIRQRGEALQRFNQCMEDVWSPEPIEEFASTDELAEPAAEPPSALPPFELRADETGELSTPDEATSSTGSKAITNVHSKILPPSKSAAPPAPKTRVELDTSAKILPPKTSAPQHDTQIELQTSAKLLPPTQTTAPTNPLVAIDEALAPWSAVAGTE